MSPPILPPHRVVQISCALSCLLMWGCEGDLRTDQPTQQEDTSSRDMMGFAQADMRDGGTIQNTADMPETTMYEDLGMQGELNLSIYERLKVNCIGCHGPDSGGWRGFATFTAFEQLLVYNPEWITPGKPEESALLPMLRGQGAPGGIYEQMPPKGTDASFAQLVQNGDTLITLPELEEFIRQLTPRATTRSPTRTIRTKNARQIVRALHDQLGLEPADFFTLGNDQYVASRQDRYPILDPDSLPNLQASKRIYAYPREFSRWKSLGGAAYQEREPGNVRPSIPQALNLVQVSQVWCRIAVQKQGNDAILRHVTLADTSQSAPLKIKENIAYLHLRMLGEPATNEVVEDLHEHIFTHYELQEGGTETAWTALCAAMIRDPLWITY